MPAEIENNEIAYAGRSPWHRMGTQTDPLASSYEWRKNAGLLWNVELRDLAFMLPGATGDLVNPLAWAAAITRSDTDKVFNVCSRKHYNPVQNEVIVDFFREFADAGHCQMETVGALRGGAVVWAAAKLSGDATARLLGQDLIEGYLLMLTSHDMSLRTIVRATQVRPVCANTIRAALRDRKGSANVFTFSHRLEWTEDVATQAKQAVGIAVEEIQYTNQIAEQLAKATIDDKGWMEFMTQLLGKDGVKDEKGILKPTAQEIWKSANNGPGADLVSAKGTFWGALNGVTHFVDHVRGKSDDTRVYSSMIGEGDRMKTTALEIARDMVGAK